MDDLYRLGDVFTLIGGGTPSTKNEKYWGEGTPWISSADISDRGTITYRRKVTAEGICCSTTNVVPCGSVVVVTRVGLGKVALLKEKMCFSQDIQGLVPKSKELKFNPLFLQYQLSQIMQHLKYQGQGTTISGITKKKLCDVKLFLPSIEVQDHIVSHIGELFSELDNGVETLRKTKQQLAVYRQAVLKKAFEGEYSALWRMDNRDVSPMRDLESIKKANPVYKDTSGDENEIRLEMPDEWLRIRMGDVFDVEVGATPSRRNMEYWNGDIPWVSSGEVRFTTICETEECITQNGLDHASTNIQPVGTIMLAMIGEGKTRGQAAILNIPAAHNQNTAAILVSKTPCQPKYIYYFLQMNYDHTRRVGSGNNQKALNKERVRALRFPFASFEEQLVIVQEIESRLSVCDSIEKTVDTALQQAEAMRQSILKKAFEGKL